MTSIARSIPVYLNRRALGYSVSVIAFIAVIVIGAVTTPNFISKFNIMTIIRAASITGIIACGLSFITISGNFVSLSVQQTAVLASVTFALALSHDWPLAAALLLVLAITTLIGIAQGVLVAQGVSPVITTIAVGAMLFGLTSVITQNKTIKTGTTVGNFIGSGTFWGIPNQTITFILVAMMAFWVIRQTRIGRTVVLYGANKAAAEASGANIKLATIIGFVISCLAAGIVAIFNATQFGQASVLQFESLNMDAVAAIIVGGVSLQGGEGTPLNAALGAIFIATLQNFMLLAGFSYGFRLLITGAAICLAVTYFHLLNRKAG